VPGIAAAIIDVCPAPAPKHSALFTDAAELSPLLAGWIPAFYREVGFRANVNRFAFAFGRLRFVFAVLGPAYALG
jgi:hypothetical protein